MVTARLTAGRIAPGHVVHRTGRRVALPVGAEADPAAAVLRGPMIDVERAADFFTAAVVRRRLTPPWRPSPPSMINLSATFWLPQGHDHDHFVATKLIVAGWAAGGEQLVAHGGQ